MKKKDKVRFWRSTYVMPCYEYFYNKLHLHEFVIFLNMFNNYKFYNDIKDPSVSLRRVRVANYELTFQRDLLDIIKITFRIINV